MDLRSSFNLGGTDNQHLSAPNLISASTFNILCGFSAAVVVDMYEKKKNMTLIGWRGVTQYSN